MVDRPRMIDIAGTTAEHFRQDRRHSDLARLVDRESSIHSYISQDGISVEEVRRLNRESENAA